MNLRVWIKKGPYNISTIIQIGAHDDRDGITVAMPMEMKHFTKEELQASRDPLPNAMEIRPDDADSLLQSFMDTLWQEGYRPKDIGTAGHLAATQAHLEDMRKIAFTMLTTEARLVSPEN